VTQQEVEARLAAQRREWQASEACARLAALFTGQAEEAAALLPDGVVIDKLVAFACSTMAWKRDLEGKDDGRRLGRSAAQHALVLGVTELLAQRRRRQLERQKERAGGVKPVDGGPVQDEKEMRNERADVTCFAQEPAYHAADKAVLGAEGVVVLDDPRAFLEVDEASVVVSVYPDIPVREVVADIARPAVMIWGRVTDELSTTPL
jgi:hypothetical protein